MRERERLEDFKGGHVACRGCKRLLYFPPGALGLPQLCCGIAYVPTQQQVDLCIYDRLQPGEIEGAVEIPTPPPVEVEGEADDDGERPVDDPYEATAQDEAELDAVAVTPEQALERRAARVAELKRRGRIDYG
jgi:hypothetical protein